MAVTIERQAQAPSQYKTNDLVIRLAGEGGEGVVSTGQMLGDAFVRYNLKIFTFQTFPAEIKGGTVMYQLRTNTDAIRSRGDVADCFAAFTQEGYDKYAADLPSEGFLLFNSDEVKGVSDRFAATYGIPMLTLARQTGESITKTTVGCGAIAGMLHMDPRVFEDLLRKRFLKKSTRQIAEMKAKGEWDKHLDKLNNDPTYAPYREALSRAQGDGSFKEDMQAPIVVVNLLALYLGYNHYKGLEAEGSIPAPFKIEPIPGEQKMVGTGNRMISLGALAAGCRFYAGYPITPASDIMEELAKFMPQFGGSVIQSEDEIAALGATIGASYAGVRAMTATSGPGLSLMVELLGLAAMLECPVVIIDAQRAGPSTGMPTKTEQGDLYLAAYAGQGDFPRFILAPATVSDCFWLTVQAFNLSEKYQTPALVLTDQSLAARLESIDRPDLSQIEIWPRLQPTADQLEHYARFEITEDGISPFAIPGTPGGQFFATGVEHDEGGHIKHDPWIHREMTDKRFRKFQTAIDNGDLDTIECYGDTDSEFGIIGWGSNKGIIEEAVDMARAQGIKVGQIHPLILMPLNKPAIEPYLQQWKKILVPENNYAGQFLTLLRNEFPGFTGFIPLHKYEGIPFTPSEILDAILEVTK